MELTKNTWIGIDIGGTNIVAGRVVNGNIVAKIIANVATNISLETFFDDIYKLVDTLINDNVKGIGIGVPSVVDIDSGIAYDIQNIPALKVVPLKQNMEKHYSVPVFVNNDVNCFAIGEKLFGKGRLYKNFVALSIGTGIGSGVIIDNKLYNGSFCGAGEIGMLAYKDSILENYASSSFFANNYKITAKECRELALSGDSHAKKIFREFGSHVGETIKNVMYMFAPESVILGGSISLAFPFFREALDNTLDTFAYTKQRENFKIEIASDRNIPILGAAALCI